MSIEKIKELWAEDGFWSIEEYVIEEGDWISEGKWESNRSIIKFEDKFYCLDRSRSGSYYSDYYYEPARIFEVERKEEVVTEVKVTYPVAKDSKIIELPED